VSVEQIGALALRTYWKNLDSRPNGEPFHVLSRREMPPWHDICNDLDWQMHTLNGGYFSKKHHGYCGVYRLVGLDLAGDLRKLATIPRACGEDRTGTLYIGETSTLNTRLNSLRLGSHRTSNLPKVLRERFPTEKLAIALLFTGRSTEWIENDLIQAYINSFGDTPPLNYKVKRE